jgi:Uma2 family endonuclease
VWALAGKDVAFPSDQRLIGSMTTATLTRTKARAQRLWTYDEMVAELPETSQPTELWNGEIIMSPAPHPDHQRIVGKFYYQLQSFVTERRLGEVLLSPCDVVLTQKRVVQPDVLFIAAARRQIIKNHIAGVPDLAMEVISETSWHRDRIHKKSLYEQFGLPEYWIIDPDSETIEVFTLTKGAYQIHCRAVGPQPAKSKLLSGFGVAFRTLLK